MRCGDKTSTVGCWASIPPWLKPPEFLWTMKLSFILQAWHQMREEGPGLSPTVAVIYLLCEGTSINGRDRERMHVSDLWDWHCLIIANGFHFICLLLFSFWLSLLLHPPPLYPASHQQPFYPPFVKIAGPAKVFFLLKRFFGETFLRVSVSMRRIKPK